MLRAWQLQAGSAADCFTRKMAGTDRIFRWGQNHREMPAGTAYHHKERNKERFRGIKFSVNLGNLLTAQNAPPLSCADVQEEATAGSAKPRRKACSVGRAGGRLGLGGTPTSEPEYPKRIFRLIACLRYRKFQILPDFPLSPPRCLENNEYRTDSNLYCLHPGC